MDDHGGRLTLDDRAGGGACIGLQFPIDPPPAALAAAAPAVGGTVARMPLRPAV
jgi:hypothetical protein